MRILITQSGENIFSEEEKRDIIEKKYRSTTTNKIYQKKLTIEKINNRRDKKNNDDKPVHKNYFIPAGISKKPDDFFSKTTSSFYPKNIRIFTDPNKISQNNNVRRFRPGCSAGSVFLRLRRPAPPGSPRSTKRKRDLE